MFPPAKPGYTALLRELIHEDRNKFYQSLQSYGKFTGLHWIMSPEPQNQSKPLPVATTDEIIFSEEFLQLPDTQRQHQYLMDNTKLDWSTIKEVSQLTAGQRDNPSWQMIRKDWLTASNFGCVLNAKWVIPSLLKWLLGDYDLSRAKGVQWGVTNEPEALKALTSKTGL